MTENAVAELTQQRTDLIDAIRAGVATVDTLHDPTVGPEDFGRVDYPFVQILPESSEYQGGGTQYDHQLRLNAIFERERDWDYLDMIGATLEAAKRATANLLGNECVGFAMPTLIEDFAGEVDGSLLVMISVQFTVTTAVEFTPT